MLARFALTGTALEGKSNEINRKAVELAKTAVGDRKDFYCWFDGTSRAITKAVRSVGSR